MGIRCRVLGVGLGISALLGSAALPALADDPKPDAKADAKAAQEMAARVAELEASVAKHVPDKGDEALDADTKAAVGLYGQVTDAKLKARLVGVVGGILKGIAHESTQLAALDALGEMADPAGAAFVGPFLVQPDTRRSPPLIEAAVEASSRMKSDDSVPALLLLVQKSDVLPVAVGAVKAFSTFGHNIATREKILVALVDALRGARSGPLANTIPETLNQMTGQNVAGAQAWIDLREQHKARLADLFLK